MIALLAILLLAGSAPVNVTPVAPTVGDPITLDFQGATTELERSDKFEVVDGAGSRWVIRAFEPGTLTINCTVSRPGEPPSTLPVELKISSVIGKGDDLTPAPLRPPRPLPANRRAWIALGIAAVAALLSWLFAHFASKLPARRSAAGEAEPLVDPWDEYEKAIKRVRTIVGAEKQWVQLSDSTRRFLSRVDPSLGRELTTTELLVSMRRAGKSGEEIERVEKILRGGDWTKFSPFGAPGDPVSSILDAAVLLARKPAPPPEGEAAA